jgi:hypothetical protein
MEHNKHDADRHKSVHEHPLMTDDQAREKCHALLIEGLRLIPFKDRIRAFAIAMKEIQQEEEIRRTSEHSAPNSRHRT